MLKEFREFVARGNVIDLAVGVIIGGAFGRIVSSLVADVIMPPVGLLLARADFRHLALPLATGRDGKPVTINIGSFVSAIVDFLIVAVVLFLIVRTINKLHRRAAVVPDMRDCPFCLSKIPVKAVRCGHCTSEVTS